MPGNYNTTSENGNVLQQKIQKKKVFCRRRYNPRSAEVEQNGLGCNAIVGGWMVCGSVKYRCNDHCHKLARTEWADFSPIRDKLHPVVGNSRERNQLLLCKLYVPGRWSNMHTYTYVDIRTRTPLCRIPLAMMMMTIWGP